MTASTTAAHGTTPNGSPSRSHRLGAVACGLILLVMTIALPFWSMAAEYLSERDVTIGASEFVTDDLYVFTDALTLNGSAARDVAVVAATIDINGSISGSLNAVGGSISIPGTIGQSVRIISDDAAISGTISGDLLILGGTTVVEDDGVIEGDVQVVGGMLEMDGTVGGDLSGNVADVTINGFVGGDVDVEVQELDVSSQADIEGVLSYISPMEADIATGAQIDGPVARQDIAPWGTDGGLRSKFFSPLVRTVWLLGTGAVLVALAPRLAAAASGNVRRPWVAGIIGLVAVALIPIVALALMVTVVGMPAGLILMTLLILALYLSQVVVGQRLGMLLLPRRWNDGSRGYLLLAMSIGVILLSALRFVPIPFVSSVVNLLVAIVGLGASVLLVRQLRPGSAAGATT